MAGESLVISQIQDAVIVNFQASRILDGAAVDSVGKQLYPLVDSQAHRKIVLDFSRVRLLSSQMISVLISLHKKIGEIGGKFVICGLTPDLHKVFKITRLDKMLSFAKNESEALSMLGVRG